MAILLSTPPMSGSMPASLAIKPASAKGNAIVPEATPIPMLRGEPRVRAIFSLATKSLSLSMQDLNYYPCRA